MNEEKLKEVYMLGTFSEIDKGPKRIPRQQGAKKWAFSIDWQG